MEAVKNQEILEIKSLKLIFERSGEIIFITDTEGLITYNNPLFTKVYGFTEDEVRGKTARILKSGTLTKEFYETFWATLLKKEMVVGELENKTKDGKLVTVRVSANPILNDDGNIIGFLAIQRDITEEKKIAIALKQKEEMCSVAINSMLDAFGIYKAIRNNDNKIVDFKIEFVNEAACKSNMMSKDEQIGKNLLDILPAHRESGLFDEYCTVVESGKPLIKESFFYEDIFGAKRLERAFNIRAVKFQDGFVASWNDVTEQKKMEIQLRQKIRELELFSKVSVGRELKMTELKKRIRELEKKDSV